MKKLLVVVLLIGVGLVGLVNYFHIEVKMGTSSAFKTRYLDKPLPPFVLTDMQGRVVRSQDLRGKRVHLNLWSTACKPCIEEFAELNQLRRQYGSGYVFLALAAEDSSRVGRLLQRRPLAYQVLPNASHYFRQLGLDAYPKNFFVDHQGIIRAITEGSQQTLGPGPGGLVSTNYEVYRQLLNALH